MIRPLTFLLFALALGLPLSAAEVRILGLSDADTQRYAAQLEPRLQFIKGRPASSWRADDAAFYLERLLLRRGYPNAEVEWKIAGNTINLSVTPGRHLLYGKVSAFQDDVLAPQTLHDYFFQPLIDSEQVSSQRAPYIREYSIEGAQNVENLLKSRGYWQARVSLFDEQINPQSERVDILVDIVRGPMHTLAAPQFDGVSSAILSDLNALAADSVGKPASSENINALHRAVTGYFSQKGYQFAEVTTESHHLDGATTLAFSIDPGKIYTVRAIHVEGSYKTKTRRILRHFNKLKQQPYNAQLADKATRKLLNTGVFEQVRVTPLRNEDNTLDLNISVSEGKTVTTKAYLGIDSYDGPIFGLSYTDLNVKRRMWQFSARGEFSQRGLLGEVGLTEPFFAGENITFNTRAFALSRRPDGYDSHEFGLDSSWEWQANDQYSIRLFTSGSVVNTSSSNFTPEELGSDNYLNLRFGLTQHLDLRDDPVLPHSGFNAKLTTEYSTIEGDESDSYFRMELNSSYRHPLIERSYLRSRFDAGLLSSSSAMPLPIDRRFFTGGSNTVRSFPERELGPLSQVSREPIGGEAYWVGSLEYVRQINEPFYLSLFYDAGQVYATESDLGSGSASHAVGLGARIHLPIGPVRVEYGHNLNRKSGEPAGAFHFSIGASF